VLLAMDKKVAPYWIKRAKFAKTMV